ncbi:MAG: FG-GAP-like repeat-containing protein [Bacteroidota bacterium]
MLRKPLLFALLITLLPAIAKTQDSCENATPVTLGTYSVDSIVGTAITDDCGIVNPGNAANWYRFSSTTEIQLRVQSSNLNGGDTRLSVFTGPNCDSLSCLAANDDVDNGLESRVQFTAMADQVYYIIWDDRWDNNPFDFTITQTIIPETEVNFQTLNTDNLGTTIAVVDMDGDYVDDIVGIGQEEVHVNRQNPDGSFTAYVMPADSELVNNPDWSLAAGDYDRNGYNDLVIGGGSAVSFLRVNDDGTAVTEIAYEPFVFSQRSNFIDINNDGHLDAFVCHDVAPNVFFLNDGANNLDYFQGSLGDIENGGNYGSIWIDFDNDRDLDMFIAKCRGGSSTININELHQNNGDGTFTEVAAQYNLADPVQTWSAAWGDYDNDGDLDVFVGASSFSDGRHKLMRNDGDTFTDITAGSGLEELDETNIETITHDFDNDGYLDLLNGGRILMLNNGDFTFRGSSITPSHGPMGDLNSDGFIDVVTGNTVHLNEPNGNNHLTVRLQGTASNINGIGARIEVQSSLGTQIREIASGTGFRYMSSLNAYFGLGQDTEIDKVVVYWPSGIIDEILAPDINTPLTVIEGNSPSITRNLPIESLSFFPNPALEQVTLKGEWPLGTQVELYNLSGQLLSQRSLNDHQIPVHDLPAGTYLLLLENDDRIHLGKLIKE